MEKMENWKSLINKKAKIVFEDGKDHFSKKEGIIIEFTPTHLILSSNEAINLIKILRIEELKNGNL
jgi:hypothetical protein